eukprot:12270014-Alexandrium_andersonii.AAC.1
MRPPSLAGRQVSGRSAFRPRAARALWRRRTRSRRASPLPRCAWSRSAPRPMRAPRRRSRSQ